MLYRGDAATCCSMAVIWNLLLHCIVATPHSGKLLLRTVANGPYKEVSILVQAIQSDLEALASLKKHGLL